MKLLPQIHIIIFVGLTLSIYYPNNTANADPLKEEIDPASPVHLRLIVDPYHEIEEQENRHDHGESISPDACCDVDESLFSPRATPVPCPRKILHKNLRRSYYHEY